jgi:hypothetical protein
MNYSHFSDTNLDEILNRLFVAIKKNQQHQIHQYYGRVRNEIYRIKSGNPHGTEEMEWLTNLDHVINAVQEADSIIFYVNDNHDIALVRKALDLYNSALQEDRLNIRELSALLAKRIKKASKILGDMLSEPLNVQIYQEKPRKIVNKIQFTSNASLTPDYLLTDIAPWIKATVDLQNVLNYVGKRQKREIRVLSITQHSPVSVSMDGASQALRVFAEMIVPWRRQHAQVMAKYEEENARLDIELKRANVLERRASAEKERNEAHKVYEETRSIMLENDLLIEKHCKRLAIDIIKSTTPNVEENEVPIVVEKMLPPLTNLLTSKLEINIKKLDE